MAALNRRWLLVGIASSVVFAASTFILLSSRDTSCTSSGPSGGAFGGACPGSEDAARAATLAYAGLAGVGLALLGVAALVLSYPRQSAGRRRAIRVLAGASGILLLVIFVASSAVWITSAADLHISRATPDGGMGCGTQGPFAPNSGTHNMVCVPFVQFVFVPLFGLAGFSSLTYAVRQKPIYLIMTSALVAAGIGAIYVDNWFGGHPRAHSDASDLVVFLVLLIGLTSLAWRARSQTRDIDPSKRLGE